MTIGQQHGRPAGSIWRGTSGSWDRDGGTTTSTDSSGGARLTLSLAGMLASIWGGIVGVSAVIAVYIEGSDWYHVLKMAYGTGLFLTVTSLLFYYGVMGMLTDPGRGPINGPVQVDMVPDGKGDRRISVLYRKELPLDKQKDKASIAEGED